jgi:threonine dehydratase
VSAPSDQPVVNRDDVLRARDAIAGRLHRTPVFSSQTLGDDVHLKAELFQKTGSFKPRGVLNKLASLTPEEKRRGVITTSAGNHAQAVAWAAAVEGIDALIVTWASASPQKIAATREYGATVDMEAADPAEAFERLAELQASSGRTLVHPFNDPTVQAGAGTVGLEIEEDVPGLDTVLVPVGGGGLISGIAAAVSCRVIAVEPERSPAFHEGLKAGKSVPVQPSSIADGLAAPFAGETAVAICAQRGVDSVLVTEAEITEAMRFLYGRAKLACEPAGAVAAAALLAGKVSGGIVCCVVSGGNVSPQTAASLLNPTAG